MENKILKYNKNLKNEINKYKAKWSLIKINLKIKWNRKF